MSGGVSGACPCPRRSSEGSMEDLNGDTVGNLNQNSGKPPRDYSSMRHFSSSSWSAEPVSIIKLKFHVSVLVGWISARFNSTTPVQHFDGSTQFG